MDKKDLVGKVTHYYDKIGVAVVRLEKNVRIGDKLKFIKGTNSFEREVSSMQFEHQSIEEGKKGQEVAMKVDQKVTDGALVYLS